MVLKITPLRLFGNLAVVHLAQIEDLVDKSLARVKTSSLRVTEAGVENDKIRTRRRALAHLHCAFCLAGK